MWRWVALVAVGLTLAIALPASAHPGGLDRHGCHGGSRSYHCHGGAGGDELFGPIKRTDQDRIRLAYLAARFKVFGAIRDAKFEAAYEAEPASEPDAQPDTSVSKRTKDDIPKKRTDRSDNPKGLLLMLAVWVCGIMAIVIVVGVAAIAAVSFIIHKREQGRGRD